MLSELRFPNSKEGDFDMVATIEVSASAIINVSVSDLINSKVRVNSSLISPGVWLSAVMDACKEFNFPDHKLDRVRSLKSLLEYDGPHGVRREVDAKIICHDDLMRGRPNQFMTYALLNSGSVQPRRWKDFKSDKQAEPVTSNYVVLSRKKELFVLTVVWRPHETWDESSMSSTPIDFWYTATSVSISRGHGALLKYLRANEQAGQGILITLMRLAGEIESSAEHAHKRAKEQLAACEARLRVLGLW